MDTCNYIRLSKHTLVLHMFIIMPHTICQNIFDIDKNDNRTVDEYNILTSPETYTLPEASTTTLSAIPGIEN